MAISTTAVVRQATIEDVPFILQCIKELALYEKEPEAVEATLDSLAATIAFAGQETTSSRPARCLVVVDTTPASTTPTPMGIALYFYNYSTWTSRAGIYLEDLYVLEQARNRGFGQLLLRELAREVVTMGGRRLDWSVLRWNKPSIEFYERVGAELMEGWVGCRLEGAALREMGQGGTEGL